ncbi:anthocyanidin 3-O-glucosyltransferase 2-like [Telopea speciosissima]|uniref:anthocyanidin 3-O-glucosyltransferase 2-like n=1 Tax=Telopea speciosissima TaxID=54955 RepID=UPI001CC55444|nr:anthocyanidin 3-O-glucosyltransferase 2-like [Telopea speciosissima]
MMKKAELVFLPLSEIGHLLSMVELARRLIDQDDRITITFINTAAPFGSTTIGDIESLGNSLADTGICFINLPHHHQPAASQNSSLTVFIENQKPHLINAIIQHATSESNSNPAQLAGFIVDFFWVSMIDVANQLEVPTYMYFTSGAATLGVLLHLPTLHNEITTELKNYEGELSIPSFFNPVPPSVLPTLFLDNNTEAYACFLYYSQRLKETAGIIVNTFADLECHAMNSFQDGQTPLVYPVGPLLNVCSGSNEAKHVKIMTWLDNQPPSSVIFLCFGSRGSFSESQVKEIAVGLEQSGHRFLWSLRRPSSAGNGHAYGSGSGSTSDFTNLEEVLPDGFLNRTKGRGLMCGWVPQTAILAHQAVGGFISHCGWNSILESLWNGVPVVVWPLYGEQKLNAFELVREFRIGFDMGLTMRTDEGGVVTAKEVEAGVRLIMDGRHDSKEVRRVKEMREKSRMAVMDRGSSFYSLRQLVKDIMDRI